MIEQTQNTEARPHSPPRRWGPVGRTLGTVALTLLVFVSLATFPSGIPWMIAGWLVGHTILAVRCGPSWLPLLLCVAVVLVKRTYWPPALWGLLPAMTAAAALALVTARRGIRRRATRLQWMSIGVLWCLWSWLTCDWQTSVRCSQPLPLDADRPVVCVGDSLTSGVPPDGGYPDDLTRLLSVPVVNLGTAGIPAKQALRLLPQIVKLHPQAVVVELGGHDFLQGRSRAETAATLEQIITTVRDAGAEVMLMEIPRGFLIDPYAGLERELARKYDLELISDGVIRNLVLWSPFAPPGMWFHGGHLSDDGLHPNAAGNRHLAKHVANALQRMYGSAVLKPARTVELTPAVP